jgi:CelD/BcsL family acetyltransferase involved in cellulose biosynthesis
VPQKSQCASYLAGSPALDPLFVSARAGAYDAGGRWIRAAADGAAAGGPLFAHATRRISVLTIRVIESAFGADMRPFTRCFEPTDAAVNALLADLSTIRDWDLCEITGLSPEECSRLTTGLARRRMDWQSFPFRVRVIDGNQTYEQYLATRGTSVNKNQRVHFKRAAREGFTFRNALAWEDIVRVLEVRNARLESGSDYTRTPEFRRFFQAFREQMAAAGQLLDVGMFKGDRLIGYQIAFRTGPVLHMYQTAFDPEFVDVRPGALTLETAIEHGLAERPALIDLMNDTTHLSHYSHQVIELNRLIFFSRGMKARLLAAAFRLKDRLGSRTQRIRRTSTGRC